MSGRHRARRPRQHCDALVGIGVSLVAVPLVLAVATVLAALAGSPAEGLLIAAALTTILCAGPGTYLIDKGTKR